MTVPKTFPPLIACLSDVPTVFTPKRVSPAPAYSFTDTSRLRSIFTNLALLSLPLQSASCGWGLTMLPTTFALCCGPASCSAPVPT